MAKETCRVCIKEELLLSNIFSMHGSMLLSRKIMCLTKVDIFPNDGLPDKICSKCIKSLEKCLQFVQLCEESDQKLRALKVDNSLWRVEDLESRDMVIDEAFPIKNDKFLDLAEADEVDIENPSLNETEIDEDNDCKNVDLQNSLTDVKKAKKQQCFTCGKVMSSRFRLKTHLRVHTGERPYSCPQCNKNFSLAQNLKIHLRVHTGEKPLQCTVCGESFAHTAGLATHKLKHTGQMPYRCVLCPRTFRTCGHLQYHIRRHTGEKNFECDSCDRAFITRSDLKKHILIHTGDRPHVCCVCGVRLTRASHLKRHMQHAHNVNELFSCPYCPQKFTQKKEYENHKKKHPAADKKDETT